MAARKSKKSPKKAAPAGASARVETPTSDSAPKTGFRALLAKEWTVPLLLVGIAFALRLVNLLLMRENSPFYDAPVTDGDFYDKMAMRIAEGDWRGGKDVFFVNPFYPYFLAAIYRIFGHSCTAVKLIQIALGSGTCLLVYLLGKRLISRPAAVIATAMAAFYGIFIYYDELLLATTVSVFTFLAALHLLLWAIEKKALHGFALAGAVLGISFVSRPSVFPFIAAFWLVYCLRDRAEGFIAARLAVYSLVAACFVLPVTIRNYVVADDFVLVSSHSGYNLYFGTNTTSGGYFGLPKEIPRTLIDSPEDQKKWFTDEAEKAAGRSLKPSEVSSFWASKAWGIIFENPGEWLLLAGNKLLRLLNAHEFSDNQNFYFSKQFSFLLRLPLVGFGLVCPLALLGMVLLFRERKQVGILYLYVIGYAGALLFFFVSSRYRMPLVPVFMLFAGHALHWIGKKLTARDFKPFLKAAVILVAAAVLTFLQLKGVEKGPFFIDYYNMGNKYLQKGRLDEAVDAFSTAVRMQPSYISAHNNLATAYEKAGRFDKSLEEWKVVLEMGRKINSPLHLRRANEHIDRLSKVQQQQR